MDDSGGKSRDNSRQILVVILATDFLAYVSKKSKIENQFVAIHSVNHIENIFAESREPSVLNFTNLPLMRSME